MNTTPPRQRRQHHQQQPSSAAAAGGGNDSDSMPSVDLVCLGTGTAHSAVYAGDVAAGYAVVVDGTPVLLVGAGPGTVRQCRRLLGAVPSCVFVHNNRTLSTAELPIMTSAEGAQGRKMTVFAGAGVVPRLVQHRFAELHDFMTAQRLTMADLCTLQALEEGKPSVALPTCPDISVTVRRAPQSELSYALLLLYRGRPLAALSGDAAADRAFYGDLSYAPTLVVDGRLKGTSDHPSAATVAGEMLDALRREAAARGQPGLELLVSGHGAAADEEYAALEAAVGTSRDGEGAEYRCVRIARPGLAYSLSALVREELAGGTTPEHRASHPLGVRSPPPRDLLRDTQEGNGRQPPAQREPSPKRQQQQQQQAFDGRSRGMDQPMSPGTFASKQWQRAHFDPQHDLAEEDEATRQRQPNDAAVAYAARGPGGHARPSRLSPDRGDSRGMSISAGPPGAAQGRLRSDAVDRDGYSHQPQPSGRQQQQPRSSGGGSRPRAVSPASTRPLRGAKKVWLFNNEDRFADPVALMIQNLRTVKQLCDRAADTLGTVKPVAGIFTLEGDPLPSLDAVPANGAVVVTKLGGASWSGIPSGGRGLPAPMRDWLRKFGATDIIDLPQQARTSSGGGGGGATAKNAKTAATSSGGNRPTSSGVGDNNHNTTSPRRHYSPNRDFIVQEWQDTAAAVSRPAGRTSSGSAAGGGRPSGGGDGATRAEAISHHLQAVDEPPRPAPVRLAGDSLYDETSYPELSPASAPPQSP